MVTVMVMAIVVMTSHKTKVMLMMIMTSRKMVANDNYD